MVASENNVYRAQYDFATISPSTAVIELLQTITNMHYLDLKPLYDVIDPEALNNLVTPTPKRGRQTTCTVTFHYQDWIITVHSDGTITGQPQSNTDTTPPK